MSSSQRWGSVRSPCAAVASESLFMSQLYHPVNQRATRHTLLLTRRDVAALLDLDTCIVAVEQAFRLHGAGTLPAPGVLAVHVAGGGFHIKAGVLELGRRYFAAKTNANFPDNPAHHGLPTIQGVLVLADADRGRRSP